jgi:hypothetical protein
MAPPGPYRDGEALAGPLEGAAATIRRTRVPGATGVPAAGLVPSTVPGGAGATWRTTWTRRPSAARRALASFSVNPCTTGTLTCAGAVVGGAVLGGVVVGAAVLGGAVGAVVMADGGGGMELDSTVGEPVRLDIKINQTP